MKVMGLSGPGHDLCFCVVEDGKIICAIEEERLSREKHGLGVKSKMGMGKEYCLDLVSCKEENLSLIVTNELTHHTFLKMKFSRDVKIINHHIAHAASAYYVSGFGKSAILVIDSSGSKYSPDEFETISIGYADNGKIHITEKIVGKKWNMKHFAPQIKQKCDCYTNSLGSLYSMMTLLCGFSEFDEGKLMGLSSYGVDKYVSYLKKFVTHSSPMNLKINFNHYEFFIWYNDLLKNKNEKELFLVKANLACAAQIILEDCVITIANYLYQQTKCTNLCFSGGVALNSVLNGKLTSQTPFKNLFIQPAAGDSGTAIGAALYGYYELLKNTYNCQHIIANAYLGRVYSHKEIAKAVEKVSVQCECYEYSYDEMIDKTAKIISEGKVVAWYQGSSEIGPRALGNRSILADPRRIDMKEILNSRVKFREMFRPFAPSVLKEYAPDYFEMIQKESPYMLLVYNVRKNKQNIVPAVTHVDGTARVQTVTADDNKCYYDLIQSFYEKTNVPIVLNTSFNIKGMPIVETPEDAVDCFLGTNIDCLVIQNYIILK